MATPAMIRIEGSQAAVYAHWDGYPEHMLPWLTAFNEAFANERGDDAIYKVAQLLRFSVREQKKYNLDPSEFTGWGVVVGDEVMGAQYEYLLKEDGSVVVKET